MELIFGILLLGPLAAKIINDRDVGAGLMLAIANVIALVAWAGLFKVLLDGLGYGVSMLVGWSGLIAMQGWFFWWAMDGTKWRKSIEGSRKSAGKVEN